MANPRNPKGGPRDEWATPKEFLNAVKDRYNLDTFDLDVCASKENAVCPKFLSKQHDALGALYLSNRGWTIRGNYKTFWCNPGFSDVLPWIEIAIRTAFYESTVFLLTHDNFSADWFKKAQYHALAADLVSPRIQFVPPKGIKKSSNERCNILWVFSHLAIPGRCDIRRWQWRQ